MTPLDALLRDLRALAKELDAGYSAYADELSARAYGQDDGMRDAANRIRALAERYEHPPAASRCACCDNPARDGKYTCEEHDNQEMAAWNAQHATPPGDREQTTVDVYADGKLVSSVPPSVEKESKP